MSAYSLTKFVYLEIFNRLPLEFFDCVKKNNAMLRAEIDIRAIDEFTAERKLEF